MKKLMSVLICVLLFSCIAVIPASASEAETPNCGGLETFTVTEVAAPEGPIVNTVTPVNSGRSKVFGDSNNNGLIEADDVLYLAKYLASGADSFPVDATFSDVNYDGYVDMLDLAVLQRHMAEWESYTSLPYGKDVYASTSDFMPDILYYESLPEHSGLEYAKLNDTQKAAYRAIEAAAESLSTGYIYTELTSKNDLYLVYYSVRRDHPEYFWLANSYSTFTSGDYCGVILKFRYDTVEARDARVDELRAELQELVDYVGDTDYQLELMIHDWICNRNVYDDAAAATGMNDTNFNSWSLYGALVNGTSVCEGYAESFQFCLAMFGIRSTVVTGSNHMWSYVELESDGYFVDPTWNDTDNGPILHEYFNLTYSQICESRSFYDDYSTSSTISNGQFNYNVPQTTATKYNYFVVNGTYLTSVDKTAVSTAIRAAADAAYNSGQTTFLVEFLLASDVECSAPSELGFGDAIRAVNSAGLAYRLNTSYSLTTAASLPYAYVKITIAS